MKFFTTLAVAFSIASAALAAPAAVPAEPTVTRVTNGALAAPPSEPTVTRVTAGPPACITEFTVTTSYPPFYQRYTTTVYKAIAAVPWDLDCKGCDLKVVTRTINRSRRPDATVTAESTLLRPPLCYPFPTPF